MEWDLTTVIAVAAGVSIIAFGVPAAIATLVALICRGHREDKDAIG